MTSLYFLSIDTWPPPQSLGFRLGSLISRILALLGWAHRHCCTETGCCSPLSPSHVLTPVSKKHRVPRFGDYPHCSITTRTIKIFIFCTTLGNYSVLHNDAKESPRYLGDPWFTLVRKHRRYNFRILQKKFMAVSHLMILQDKELIQAFYKAVELKSTWTQESLETLEEIYGYLGPSPL